MQGERSIKAKLHRVPLTYFVQDRSHGCPDYNPRGEVFHGDCELFPPFLIILLAPNRLTEEFIP